MPAMILYTIKCNPHYNNTGTHFLRDQDACIICLAERDDAQALCAMLDAPLLGDGVYLLEHNQYARPEHAVDEVDISPRMYYATCIYTREEAMRELDLQHDFAPDGSRLKIGGAA